MGEKIGIDSVVFIYLLEENKRYLMEARGLFKKVEKGELTASFSSIGLIEILTGPKKKGRFDLASQYKELIAHFPNLDIMGINERIVDLASDLRAKYNITTPDAIHIATAIDSGALRFITNDRGLRKIKEIEIKILS